ncbi:46b34e1a-60c1-4319-b54f-ba11a20430c9-CDS [Sclerotinia trifoliorum]|uniref:46b34e1a-60c1-4319-b54f-ba11a20430c9-CDS n=1 Tax=Sclerotinia trifoliorum TaxID=28548 RepID=A0A8H2VSG0_9HELO|nr:46b34e1a-60c1-4319-b54f-ba11a20430c9-CDS [Sclerotinia trifoliorum]
MPHHHRRKSTLSRESSSSSSESSRSSTNRKRSHEASRNSGSSRHHTRDREERYRNDVKEGSGAGDGVGVGKRIFKTVEKLENPVKKFGKLVLWGAPLILAGLEVRHEWHHHSHKRRMMDKEYEKAHLEIQLQMGKDGKKEGITIEGTKSHGPAKEKEETSEPSSDEVHILPYPAKVYYPVGRPSQHPSRRNTEAYQPYLIPPHVPEAPYLDVREDRRPGIRVKRPGSRDVLFPRVRSTSESIYEYRRW